MRENRLNKLDAKSTALKAEDVVLRWAKAKLDGAEKREASVRELAQWIDDLSNIKNHVDSTLVQVIVDFAFRITK